jgi:hypothetical protein
MTVIQLADGKRVSETIVTAVARSAPVFPETRLFAIHTRQGFAGAICVTVVRLAWSPEFVRQKRQELLEAAESLEALGAPPEWAGELRAALPAFD